MFALGARVPAGDHPIPILPQAIHGLFHRIDVHHHRQEALPHPLDVDTERARHHDLRAMLAEQLADAVTLVFIAVAIALMRKVKPVAEEDLEKLV